MWIPVANVLAWTVVLAVLATWLVRRSRGRACDRERDPWSRYGWVVWGAWLVFLVFPVLESLAADTTLRRTVGLTGTAVFGLVYIGSLLRDGVGADLPAQGRRRIAALGALALITALEAVAIGLGAVSFLPFLMAFGMFALPRPANWWFAGLVTAGLAVPWVLDPDEGWVFVSFVVVAVGLGTGAGRLMADQGEGWSRVQEQLAVTAERDRVARDVHDVLGHSLTVVTVKAELAERLVDADPARAKAELAEVQQLARQALAEIRTTVSGLRGTALEDELAAAADALEAAGIEASLPGDPEVLRPAAPRGRGLGPAGGGDQRGAAQRRPPVPGRGAPSRAERARRRARMGRRDRGQRPPRTASSASAASGGALEVAPAAGGGTDLEVRW